MPARVIALAGFKGSGKTEVARILASHGMMATHFAQPLKDMLKCLGLSDPELYGALKEKPSPLLCGCTPRHAMQTLGTEWRDMIHTELWTRIWEQRAREYLLRDKERAIVVDDLRFPHEVAAVKKFNGVVWYIDRKGLTSDGHASEQPLSLELIDTVVGNYGTLLDLEEKVHYLLNP